MSRATNAGAGGCSLEDDSYFTSNDLLRHLIANQSRTELNYHVVSQSADDVRDIENAPHHDARSKHLLILSIELDARTRSRMIHLCGPAPKQFIRSVQN